MNNPLRILQAVDARLDQPIDFFLFGRAALVLGFTDPPTEAVATQDVDGIIPSDLLASLRVNERWWMALKAANQELEAEGLYLTHLFDEEQIILRANWREYVVLIPNPGLQFLMLRRPATIDLILTKMMRGPDPDDMKDVGFYLERESAIGVLIWKSLSLRQLGRTSPKAGNCSRQRSLTCSRWLGNSETGHDFAVLRCRAVSQCLASVRVLDSEFRPDPCSANFQRNFQRSVLGG